MQKLNMESAVLALAKRQPLLRARELNAQALPTMLLSRLVAAGKLERVARSVYSRTGRALSEHRSRAEVALRALRGVVSLLSALRVQGIGTQAPFELLLAIPPHTPTHRLDQPTLHVVRMSGLALSEGVEPIDIDGVLNTNKTVADCFKYRNKIGRDVALEALHKLNMDALWHFAAVNRVANVMRPYLESVAV